MLNAVKLRRIQKDHIEQEIEANWTKKQEVGYKSPYLQKEKEQSAAQTEKHPGSQRN